MPNVLRYRDAVALMGGESSTVSALDDALGGLLLAATPLAPQWTLSLFDAKVGVVRLAQQVVTGLGDHVRRFSRYDRTQRLCAAHTVIVVAGFFEGLDSVGALPFDIRSARLSAAERRRLAEVSHGRDLVASLLTVQAPAPYPSRSYEESREALRAWYAGRTKELLRFLAGLAAWERLQERERQEASERIRKQVPQRAIAAYDVMYRRLAVDAPEFGFWASLQQHAATHAAIEGLRGSLSVLQERLRAVGSNNCELDDRREAIARAYRAVLDRPILADPDFSADVVLPTLQNAYLDPDFRLRRFGPGDLPATEWWWQDTPVQANLAETLAALVTAPYACEVPILVLGHPGAGKSVLTRIIGARLPPEDFLTVRVELREVPADADVQQQIEHAIRRDTGETMTWTEFARSAGGALPVVLLDGFDELLQATGVSQSDYLESVVRFQQRELDQGRAVAVLVTSRMAVVERARIPPNTTIIRLEPFALPQVARWLEVWNAVNADTFARRGIAPLAAETVLRQGELGRQPLLLLLLALYDSAQNALRQDVATLDASHLYERLLIAFTEREVRKNRPGLPDAGITEAVELELTRLSVTAFAAFNRGRLWTTGVELDADLQAILGEGTPQASGLRAPISPADSVISGFFFVQRAQAVRDGARLETYEFLHATFGEYLVARLIHRVLHDMARQEAAASTAVLTAGGTQDGLLYALLSFTPLTSRYAIVDFLSQLAHRIPEDDPLQLRRLPATLFRRIDHRDDSRFVGYRPVTDYATSRFALYSLNLVLLTAVYSGEVCASQLTPEASAATRIWRRHAQLWKTALTADEWINFIMVVSVRRTCDDSGPDIRLTLDDRAWATREAADLEWTYPSLSTSNYETSHPLPGPALFMDASILGDPFADLAMHALEPLGAAGEHTLTSIVTVDGASHSVAHLLLRVLVGAATDAPVAERIPAYNKCVMAATAGWVNWEPDTTTAVTTLLLFALAADAPHLDGVLLADWLSQLLRHHPPNGEHAAMALKAATSRLQNERDADARELLREIVVVAASGHEQLSSSAWAGLRLAGYNVGEIIAMGLATPPN